MPITAGAHVGPYEVLGLLDSGGMGEVYRARDTRLDRLVAIKTIRSFPHVGPDQLERFKREARAISRVSHPHICALYDIGEHDGAAFLVMELLDGETLARRLADGPLPPTRACAVAADIADALDAAHRHGVIHRDLKPSNVMLTRGGVKLLDFGLAKLRTGEPEPDVQEPTRSIPLTQPSTVVGTLPYMAPEQVEGHETDARTDIFALGVVCLRNGDGSAALSGSQSRQPDRRDPHPRATAGFVADAARAGHPRPNRPQVPGQESR